MSTLDDAPLDGEPGDDSGATPTSVYGEKVQAMLTAAESSPRIRVQALGAKAVAALDALLHALAREQKIAEHEAALARLRRGED